MTSLSPLNAAMVRQTVREHSDVARANLGLPSRKWAAARAHFDNQHRLIRDLRASLTKMNGA